MSENTEQCEVVYRPKNEEKKAVSFIWLLPLIILCILGWIAYESYMKKGTNIVVIFKSAEGLKEGVTPLEYKGLTLGKVTKISINDVNSVKVNILVKNEVANYVANEGSLFWIKKPTVSLTKISGLSTLISGYKIELSPQFRSEDEMAKEKLQFYGLDSKPDGLTTDDGYYVSLIGNDKDNVETGTPIFYNKFQIGEIVAKEFKNEKVYLKTYIYDKFNYLVNKSSKFIMNDALKVNYGPAGLQIEVGSLYSALVGGITVVTEDKNQEKISPDENYLLYTSKDDLKAKIDISIKFLDAEGISSNTPIIYKGIKIGELTELFLTPYDISSKAYIYDKYRYMLTENTRFFIEKPELNLDGAKNLGNVVKGNYVSLTYEKGRFSDTFEARSISNVKESDLNQSFTLYANNLGSITKNTKIYYKNIPVGKVLDYSLTKDLKRVKINISIDNKYKKLVNNHTLFYDINSKLVELNNLNLNINYSGFTSLLNGGIGISDVKRKDKLNKKSFKLYSSYKDVEKLRRIHNEGFTVSAYFSNDFIIKKDMAVVYKNQEIGFVKDIKFNDSKSKVKLFIYSKYKKYLNKTSRFYKKGVMDFKASLNGVIFEMDNFTSLLEGSIHLEKKSNKIYKNYQIFSSKDHMESSSNSITIIFDDVEGLHENFSNLTYKGVKVGKVSSISLNSKQQVIVKAQIFKDYNSFAKKGTIFYLKKPRISLEEVENIGSSVMAVNIGIIKTKGNEKQRYFEGYNSLPSVDKSQFGRIFKVESFHASSVNKGAPIYYKNVKIGKINKIDLSSDASRVVMDCLIYDKYTKFIRANSIFYDISGFNLKFSLFSGTKVESNTFTSILKGGLVVVTPMEYNRPATSKDRFILVEELREDWESVSPSIKKY